MNNDTFSGDNNTSGNGTGGQDEDDHDPMTITITSIPVIMTGSYDLSITKSVNKTIVYSGDVISYTLHYMNLGDAVSGVVIHEIYPTQFITNFPSSFMIGYLATGASADIVITGTVIGVSGDSLVNGATIYYYDGLLTGEEISYTNNYATAVVLITEPVTYIPGTPTLPGGTTYTPIPLPTPVVPTPYLPTLPYEEPKTMVQVIRKMIDNTFDYISETTEHFIAPQALPNTGAGDE